MKTPISLLELAQALVRRPSVTPTDSGCQAIIIHQLETLGFTIHRLPFGGVDNFYARLGKKGRNFCFAGHSDVVPPGNPEAWQHEPFAANIVNGLLFGRGICDMKGAIAAMIIAVQRFLHQYPHFLEHDSLSFLITGDEEGDAINGTVKVLAWLQHKNEPLDYCLVGEPTSIQILGDCLKNGRRGSVNGIMILQGKQGHVAYPHLADNPIHRAMPILAQLAAMQFDSGNAHFPATSLQFTSIQAGDGTTNVIPDTLKATFNIRFSPESSPEAMEQKIRHLLDQGAFPAYSLTMNLSGWPFLTPGGKLLSALTDSIRETQEHLPELSTGGGTSDARFISRYCSETVEFGLVGTTMHKTNEATPIEDLERLATIYQHLLQKLFYPS